MSLILNVIEGFHLSCTECGGTNLQQMAGSVPRRYEGQLIYRCMSCYHAHRKPDTFQFRASITPINGNTKDTPADFGEYHIIAADREARRNKPKANA